jgi:beta-galactosidase/beta-glucuronidase
MRWQPVPGPIMTKWAKDVSPEIIWREYPRPQMTRHKWKNLNGLWDYAIGSINQEEVPDYQGQILVPFPIESSLSGVKLPLRRDQLLWYHRTFTIPTGWHRKRILLHFGAVDWKAKVFINGQLIGCHTGGYLPFHFDVTGAIRNDAVNELIVSVWDPTDTHWQQRGKQVLRPKTIWYTAVSGIWQTVWLEPVPQVYIARLKITPDVDAGIARVKVDLDGINPANEEVCLRLKNAGELISVIDGKSTETEIKVPISNPKLWSPACPNLYDLEVSVGDDKVGTYFGMRKFSREKGRLCLNDEPLFEYGPLDQGYWPDGLYTPPTDEAMRFDIDLVKGLGCNMLRKHVKVEPARYYYYCDKVGLIVWQDMPNGGAVVDEIRMFLINLMGMPWNDKKYLRAGRADPESREDFRFELQELVDHLHNFACIGMWVPFNEGWGQFEAKSIADWLKTYDPTRPVDHASGWFDQNGGDCRSLHIYFRKIKKRKMEKERATVLSEFGGSSLKISGHLWNPLVEFGYQKTTSSAEFTSRYSKTIVSELLPWVETGLSAAVYTQTTDVEDEVNGFITYDRQVEKMDFSEIRRLHRKFWE